MFGLFKKKTQKEQLEETYEKLLKESYKLSTINRTASDAKAAEADAILKKISGIGLMLSIELDNFEEVERTMKRCIVRGVIIDWFLYNTNCLRISPPLIITKTEIQTVCKTILESLD